MKLHDPFVFEHANLDCGGRAIWQHNPQGGYIVIGAAVKVGSIADPPGQSGMAHLIEHMLFEGTADYPNSKTMSIAAESRGGCWNAMTNARMTAYIVMMPAWQAQLAWHILEQMMFHPLLRPSDFERQIRDVSVEIATGKNSVPTNLDESRIERLLFGPDLARGNNILGTNASIGRITLDDVRRHHSQYYSPANMNFMAFGNLSSLRQSWPTFLNHELRRIPSGRNYPWRNCRLSPNSTGSTWISPRGKENSPQVYIAGRVHTSDRPTLSSLRKNYHAAGLVQHILCDAGQSSILFQELREKKNLAYAFGSHLQSETTTALWWAIDATAKDINDAEAILDVIRRIVKKRSMFSKEKIAQAKESKLGRLALIDISAQDAFTWATRFLPETPIIPTQSAWWQEYEHITVDDVQEVLARDFEPAKWVTIKYYPASH